MDSIKQAIDSLTELSDDQITDLEDSITSEFEALYTQESNRTPQSIDAMRDLADMMDSVRGEQARREALAAELAAQSEELNNRIHGSEAAVDDEVPAEDDPEVPEDPDDEEEEPMTASAETEDETTETVTEAAVEEAPAAVEETVTETEAAVEEISEAEAPAEAEAASDVEDAVVETEVTEASEAAAEETVAEVEAPAEAEASNTETPSEPQAQEEALTVTASAEETSIEVPADRRPVAQAVSNPVAITAGADIPGYQAGSQISDMDEVAKLFAKRLDTLRRVNGGDGEQTIVASLATTYPEALVLKGDEKTNTAQVTAALEEREALVASGGWGTPSPVRYDIFGFGTDARPVKDSLPKFQADRGSITFVVPPVLSDYADAVGIWTAETDADPGEATKNVLVVEGASTITEDVDAVTVQLQIGNLLSRAYPEYVARHNELALIQHARVAELNTLSKMESNSTAVTTNGLIGVARDFLVRVKVAAAAYRSRHRIDPNTRLQAIIPMWVYEAMMSDLTLNAPGDGSLDVTKAEIAGYLATSNVSLTASYDLNTFGAQTAGPLLEFPDTFKWFLFSEGTFLFLDGGTLDLGIVRDSALVGTNDYRMFVETFEGLAKVGIESLAITSNIVVDGSAAALRDLAGGGAASASDY